MRTVVVRACVLSAVLTVIVVVRFCIGAFLTVTLYTARCPRRARQDEFVLCTEFHATAADAVAVDMVTASSHTHDLY